MSKHKIGKSSLAKSASLILVLVSACSHISAGADEAVSNGDIESGYDSVRSEAKFGGHEAKLAAFLYVFNNIENKQIYVDEAVIFLAESAVAGNPEAQYYLGFLLQTGTWMREDIDAAIPWLMLSAEQGCDRAYMLLGTNYFRRYFLEKNPKMKQAYYDLSIGWLEKANLAGFIEAKSMLGSLLVGHEKTSKRGYQLLVDAASAGDIEAKETLRLVEEHRGEKER